MRTIVAKIAVLWIVMGVLSILSTPIVTALQNSPTVAPTTLPTGHLAPVTSTPTIAPRVCGTTVQCGAVQFLPMVTEAKGGTRTEGGFQRPTATPQGPTVTPKPSPTVIP